MGSSWKDTAEDWWSVTDVVARIGVRGGTRKWECYARKKSAFLKRGMTASVIRVMLWMIPLPSFGKTARSIHTHIRASTLDTAAC